jgi:hypothetical protein
MIRSGTVSRSAIISGVGCSVIIVTTPVRVNRSSRSFQFGGRQRQLSRSRRDIMRGRLRPICDLLKLKLKFSAAV